MASGIRCAVVPPAPVPYREPLFRALAERPGLTLRVIYQAAASAGWNQAATWFPHEHAYDSVHLRSAQRERAGGRTPVVWPRGLERELRSFGPDVVVVWEYGPAALRAWAWCRRRGIPLVIFSELTPWAAEALPRPQLRLHRWLAGRAQGFIVASSAARARLLGLGVPADVVEVSLQSFDAEPIRAAVATAAPCDGGPVRVLAVGRLVPDKNFGGLIEAFARAAPSAGEAELQVVGTGPLEAELRDLASRLGVPVRFSGYVAPDALPAVYAAADAFVLPSVFEPFGVVVREAVAAGLPIVCSRTIGAAGDVAVADRNALLADPRDPDQLSGALARIIGDGELRAAFARASREIDAENGNERSVAAFERAVVRARDMFAG